MFTPTKTKQIEIVRFNRPLIHIIHSHTPVHNHSLFSVVTSHSHSPIHYTLKNFIPALKHTNSHALAPAIHSFDTHSVDIRTVYDCHRCHATRQNFCFARRQKGNFIWDSVLLRNYLLQCRTSKLFTTRQDYEKMAKMSLRPEMIIIFYCSAYCRIDNIFV